MTDESFEFSNGIVSLDTNRLIHVCSHAAQYGADMELDRCCEELLTIGYSIGFVEQLRSKRRPDPLKELINEFEEYVEFDSGCKRVEIDKYKLKKAISILKSLSK